MTPESLKQAANATKQMNLDEAYKILGSDSNAGIEEVMKVRHILALCLVSMVQQRSVAGLAYHAAACHILWHQSTAVRYHANDVTNLCLVAAVCSSHAAK